MAAQAAQGSVDTEQFEAAVPGAGLLSTWGTAAPGMLAYDLGLSSHYALRPVQTVRLVPGDLRPVGSIVPGVLRAELLGRLGLGKWADVSFALPFVQTVGTPQVAFAGRSSSDFSATTLGDIRLSAGLDLTQLYTERNPDGDGLGLAVRLGMWLPTGDVASLQGDGSVRVEPRLAADWRLKRWYFAGNVGWLFRSRSQVAQVVSDDAFRYTLLASGELYGEWLDWVVTGQGALQSAKQINPLNATERAYDGNNSPMEALAGVHAHLGQLAGTLAAGAGLNSAVGTPVSRVVLQLGWVAEKDPDWDRDGVLNAVDRCPKVAEDKDGFEDADGCPDPDNDHDGIIDTADKCPNEAEDVDNFEDSDGCVDPDNDQDGVLDTADKCPNDPEDKDNFEDADGCPDLDNDKDGILDKADKCPNVAEDKDGFEDADGCPDPDNDKDGIPDVKDKCPNEPEDMDGFEDLDGCPDPDNDQDKILDPDDKCPDDATNKCKAARVGGEIVIYERVEFAVNKAVIRKESFGILDAVVAILAERPDITHMEVQGHTDSDGDDNKNLTLSQARAEAVLAYLANNGIERERLVAKGYGETKPMEPNDSKEHKQLNRRVQFVIQAAGVSEKK
jgi:outer membrane protein OmpA-like peptidoglycan-associated protein